MSTTIEEALASLRARYFIAEPFATELRQLLEGTAARNFDAGVAHQKKAAPSPKAKQYRDALKEAVAALETCDANFESIRDDWSDPRTECRAGRDACAAALGIAAAVLR